MQDHEAGRMSGRHSGRDQAGHLRRLASQLVDPETSSTQRAAQAELLVQSAEDVRSALRVASTVVPGSQLVDAARVRVAQLPADVRREAGERLRIRSQAAGMAAVEELRALPTFPTPRPVAIPDPASTGLGVAPLIREYGIPWDYSAPVVPGVVGGTAAAEINPVLPVDDVPSTIQINDVSGGADWFDLSVLVASLTLQVVGWVDPAGAVLLGNAVRDLVDVAAEEHAVSVLEAAAGGTAAYVDAGTLDAAEGAAGAAGNGAAELVLVNPVDWPAVRRELGSAWAAGPHPVPVVTSGATAGTVTFCGPGAFWLLVSDYIEDGIVRPRSAEVESGMVRPFKMFVRNPAAIRTVTGI